MSRLLLLACVFCSISAFASPPEIVKVSVNKESSGLYHFLVTIKHEDTGWEHYADAWSVVLEDKQLGERVLYHPHETEQPFTRGLGDVQIPAGVDTVYIRAKCNKGEYSALFPVKIN